MVSLFSSTAFTNSDSRDFASCIFTFIILAKLANLAAKFNSKQIVGMKRPNTAKTEPGMRIAIYPGSFDPLTNGHLDVIARAAKLFDKVIVAVATNDSKQPLFSLEERVELVRRSIPHIPQAEADAFHGLLVDYVRQQKGQAIIRGLRAVSDFEFEFQLALMNRKLDESIETIFMMPKDTYTFLSSRIIKEIARLGGDVTSFLPPAVKEALLQKLLK